MLLFVSAFLVAVSADVATLTLADCQDSDKFIANLVACLPIIQADQAAPVVVSTTDTDFVAAEEETETVADRSADLSGCGLHRDCQRCAADNVHNCQWNPGTGCLRRFNTAPSVCTPYNNLAPKCSVLRDCQTCTSQNGCVFFQGQCTYSSGTGCQNDPARCINYSWMCPAPMPVPFAPQQVMVAPPVAVQYDRVAVVVAEVDAMAVGMSAQEIRRLRSELDAMLLRKEQAATPYYAPQQQQYYEAPYANPVANPWATSYATVPTPSSFPPSYTSSAYDVNSLGYVNSFTNTVQNSPSFTPWSSTPSWSTQSYNYGY